MGKVKITPIYISYLSIFSAFFHVIFFSLALLWQIRSEYCDSMGKDRI